MRHFIALTLALLGSCAALAADQSPQLPGANRLALPPGCTTTGWHLNDQFAPPPAPRVASAVAADDKRAVLILFGGRTLNLADNDTWQWQGDQWAELYPATRPDARYDHAMAYDPQRDRIYLFGGQSPGSGYLGDTWAWDGNNWALLPALSVTPSPRAGHVMAFDEVLQQVILFGGYDGATDSDETWAFDGTIWNLIPAPGPSARGYAAAASDPIRRRVVLFGGTTGNNPGAALGDTWEWNGTSWTEVFPLSSPPACSRQAMAYSGGCGQVLLAGGMLADLGDPTATWRWNGVRWSASDERLLLSSLAMASDLASSQMVAFGGAATANGDSVGVNTTSLLCCGCDDEIAALDSLGTVIFPVTLDPAEPITYVDVDEEVGLVSDEFPQFDTDADSWYGDFPCLTAIGGGISPEDDDLYALDDSLAALGINVPAQTIADSLAVWEGQILAYAQGQPDFLPTATATGPMPAADPDSTPYCPPEGGTYLFGGRDIVFVHGLMLDHILDRILGVPGAGVDWREPTVFPGAIENQQFYDNAGYYRAIALENWRPHIERFLTSRGIKNRYLIVAYPCSARLEVGVHAVLTQIGDAMRDGINVIDLTGNNNTAKFGTPSFVIVSHSTGGPLANAALWSAQQYPNLGAEAVANRCKAQVSLVGAFGGSRLASAAVALSPALNVAATAIQWLCPLINIALTELGHDPIDCPPNSMDPIANSVLIDLSPQVMKWKWGDALDNTNVPTVLVNGGHPSAMGILKNILHPGFDDGVLNQNSVTSNPAISYAWPQGFIAADGYLGLRRTYDRGMKQSSSRRAKLFYRDQVFDKRLQPLTREMSDYVAATEILHLSPAGMLQSVGSVPGSLFDPRQRRNQHLSFMGSAGDHASVRSAEFYPRYKPTGDDPNWEEIRTIRGVDLPAYYMADTPGPPYFTGDDQPLLEPGCIPAVTHSVMGRYVEFKINIFGRKFVKRWWIWKRHYFRPTGSWDNHICDYVYDSILNCGPGIPKCAVSAVGEVPGASELRGVSPNPFNAQTTVSFFRPTSGRVRLEIYDVAGRLVRTLIDEVVSAGTTQINWNGLDNSGRAAASGIYLVRLGAGLFSSVQQVALVR